jgi:hypothetical protein
MFKPYTKLEIVIERVRDLVNNSAQLKRLVRHTSQLLSSSGQRNDGRNQSIVVMCE